MIKLSLKQVIGNKGDKEVINTKTISNINQDASDENLKAMAEAMSGLMIGQKKDILKIVINSLN